MMSESHGLPVGEREGPQGGTKLYSTEGTFALCNFEKGNPPMWLMHLN